MNNLNKYHIRMDGIKEYLGGKCVDCDSINDLEIDHIDPSTKSFTISDKVFTNIDSLLEEVEKCQLLCKSCHIKKTTSEQTTRTHGTHAMYRRGKCRCNLCVEANRAYARKLYHKNK